MTLVGDLAKRWLPYNALQCHTSELLVLHGQSTAVVLPGNIQFESLSGQALVMFSGPFAVCIFGDDRTKRSSLIHQLQFTPLHVDG